MQQQFQQTRRQDLAAGGPKTRRGATFLKYSIGCMQQPVGQTRNGGEPISNWGPGTTGPPLATALNSKFFKIPCLVVGKIPGFGFGKTRVGNTGQFKVCRGKYSFRGPRFLFYNMFKYIFLITQFGGDKIFG